MIRRMVEGAGAVSECAATSVADFNQETIGRGRPCLIVHGGPGLSHSTYHALDPLGTIRTLVYWDHRGHGSSAPLPPGDVGIELFADDAIRVADELGLQTFAVLGHSFGGWVAQELALRHPDRVSALVLASTTPGQLGRTESASDDQGPAYPALDALMRRRPATNLEAVEIYRALAPWFLRDADPAAFLAALDPSVVSADSMNRVFDALDGWSSVDRLGDITCPTLVLAGHYDVFCSLPQLLRIARRVPGAELHVFEHSGHFMWLEEPEEFFRIVGVWLQDH